MLLETLFTSVALMHDFAFLWIADTKFTCELQTIILFLNIFVIFIPFIQFFVLRRPPFGNLPLWERVLESCMGACGFESPFGRRVSRSSGVHGRRMTSVTKLDISLISKNYIQSAAGQQDRSSVTPMFRHMSLKDARRSSRRDSLMSKSRRVSAAGLDDISRLRARRSADVGNGQPQAPGLNREHLWALTDRFKSEEPAVERAQPEHHYANSLDGPSQQVTGALCLSQPPILNYMSGLPDASYELDGGMQYYAPFEPFRQHAILEREAGGWLADDDNMHSAYGVFPQPVVATADGKSAAISIPQMLQQD